MKNVSLSNRSFNVSKTRTMVNLLTLSLVFTLSLGLAACSFDSSPGNPNQDEPDAQATSQSSKQLVASDVAAFDTQDDLALTTPTTGAFYKAFQSIFNGFTGTDIRAYMDTRIHSFFSQYDVAHMPEPTASELSGVKQSGPLDENAKAVVGASNIGALAWFQTLFVNRPLTFVIAGQTIQPTSSRVGLMMIGPGYDRVQQRADGTIFRFPLEYRQSILIHEARHSDCTGGITQSAIDEARMTGDFNDFLQATQATDCAHLHAICPSWHSLHGLAGCDDRPWGAYAVQSTYAFALMQKAKVQNDVVLKNVMEFSAADAATRLLYVIDATDAKHVPHISRLWTGQFGPADMSSSGVINQ